MMKQALKKRLIQTKGILISALLLLFSPAIAFADVGTSKLATGTQALVSDLTTWLMILAPTVTVLFVVYYLIRKSAADEMESKNGTAGLLLHWFLVLALCWQV